MFSIKGKIQAAFTLIELLVVIAIIGILSGLIVITMGGMTEKANIAKSQVFSNSLRNALMINLVSEWKLDGTAVDSWSGGNNGTWSGSAGGDNTSANYRPSSECVSGQCLDFDGTDDYVYVSGSNSASSNLAITGAITLSAWVKFDELGSYDGIVGRGMISSSAGNYGYFLAKNSSNTIRFDTYSETARSGMNSTGAITDSNWHLIVATWDGTTNTNGKKIYIDGALGGQATSSISVMGQPTIYQFRMGKDSTSSSSYQFNGLIDDVRVYNAAVPTSRIKQQYYLGMNNFLINKRINPEEYRQKMIAFQN